MLNFSRNISFLSNKLSIKKPQSYLKLASYVHLSTSDSKVEQKLNENHDKVIFPLEHEDFFQVNEMVKLEELFK